MPVGKSIVQQVFPIRHATTDKQSYKSPGTPKGVALASSAFEPIRRYDGFNISAMQARAKLQILRYL